MVMIEGGERSVATGVRNNYRTITGCRWQDVGGSARKCVGGWHCIYDVMKVPYCNIRLFSSVVGGEKL